MGKIQRVHSASFKARVSIELIKGVDAISVICSKYGIHPTQATRWKQRVLEGLEGLFSDKPERELKKKDTLIEELYKQVGQLKVELDWLKKKFQ